MSRYVDLRIDPFNGAAGVYGIPAKGKEQLIASISIVRDDSLRDIPHYLAKPNPGIIDISKPFLRKGSVVTTIFNDTRQSYSVDLPLAETQQRIKQASNPTFTDPAFNLIVSN